MFDKNYFLEQLRGGAKIDDIGVALANAMNEAMADYEAEKIAAAKAAEEAQVKATIETNKREMALELIDIIRAYGHMVAPDTANILDDFDDKDIDMMVQTLDEMFHMMSALAQLKETLPKTPVKRPIGNSDDEVLAKFIASLV